MGRLVLLGLEMCEKRLWIKEEFGLSAFGLSVTHLYGLAKKEASKASVHDWRSCSTALCNYTGPRAALSLGRKGREPRDCNLAVVSLMSATSKPGCKAAVFASKVCSLVTAQPIFLPNKLKTAVEYIYRQFFWSVFLFGQWFGKSPLSDQILVWLAVFWLFCAIEQSQTRSMCGGIEGRCGDVAGRFFFVLHKINSRQSSYPVSEMVLPKQSTQWSNSQANFHPRNAETISQIKILFEILQAKWIKWNAEMTFSTVQKQTALIKSNLKSCKIQTRNSHSECGGHISAAVTCTSGELI